MFEIIINTDNAAFEDDDDAGAHEIACILRELAARLEEGLGRRAQDGALRDRNGNKVGSWGWPR